MAEGPVWVKSWRVNRGDEEQLTERDKGMEYQGRDGDYGERELRRGN